MEGAKKQKREFKVNEYLTLKLENGKTNIYVNGKLFTQCKFLLLNIPVKEVEEFEDIESIDEAAEKLDSSMERREGTNPLISPKEEFWGHCSNVQAWFENGYDTRLMHRNLAFPLLKALMEAGDPLAKKVFKEEIAIRFDSGYPSVVSYLINQNYLKYLNRDEVDALIENPAFLENITKYIYNFDTIPKWFYKKIRKKIPKDKRKSIFRLEYYLTFKVALLGDSNEARSDLTRLYMTNLFRSDTRMTIGVEFEIKTLEVDNRRIKLQIWDFSGEERFRFLLPTYARGSNGILFMYDINNPNSLAHINDWVMSINRETREEEVPMLVVGIASSREQERKVSRDEGTNLAKSIGADGYIECNTHTGENVEEVFNALSRLMLANSGFDAMA